jgi:hypothetical protein
MSDQTKDIIAIITEAINYFKDGNYAEVQEILKDNGFSKAIKQMQQADLQKIENIIDDKDLYNALADLFDKVGYRKANTFLISRQNHDGIKNIDAKEAFNQFFENFGEKIKPILASDDYKAVIQQNIQSQTLQDTVASLRQHMGILTDANVAKRITDDFLETLNQPLQNYESEKNQVTIKSLDNTIHALVDKISNIMQGQVDALNLQEQKVFNQKGGLVYNLDLTMDRWKGVHNAGQDVNEVPIKTAPNPSNNINLLQGGIKFLGNNNTTSEIPKNEINNATKTVKLQGDEINEFVDKGFLLDTNWKKIRAGASLFAGVGIAAHGIYNIYSAINQNIAKNVALSGTENNKAENDNHQDGINWLRLVVGAGEIGVGTIITTRQLIGRHIWELGKPIGGSFTPLCNHGNASNGHRV